MNLTVGKNKASANVKAKMNVTVGKNKASSKLQAKVVRKPLGDLTNTLRPRALEKPSKKNYVDNNVVTAVENYDWVKEEGFLHNHDKCIECSRNATMIKDILPKCASPTATASPMELVKLDEFQFQTPLRLDLYAECSLTRQKTRVSHSPSWSINDHNWIIDWDIISPFKLKEDL